MKSLWNPWWNVPGEAGEQLLTKEWKIDLQRVSDVSETGEWYRRIIRDRLSSWLFAICLFAIVTTLVTWTKLSLRLCRSDGEHLAPAYILTCSQVACCCPLEPQVKVKWPKLPWIEAQSGWPWRRIIHASNVCFGSSLESISGLLPIRLSF